MVLLTCPKDELFKPSNEHEKISEKSEIKAVKASDLRRAGFPFLLAGGFSMSDVVVPRILQAHSLFEVSCGKRCVFQGIGHLQHHFDIESWIVPFPFWAKEKRGFQKALSPSLLHHYPTTSVKNDKTTLNIVKNEKALTGKTTNLHVHQIVFAVQIGFVVFSLKNNVDIWNIYWSVPSSLGTTRKWNARENIITWSGKRGWWGNQTMKINQFPCLSCPSNGRNCIQINQSEKYSLKTFKQIERRY